MIPEESDDLWHLYNLLAEGDTIKSKTVRKIKDTNEKRHLVLTLTVTSVEYDAKGDCIRIAGQNIEENEWVKMGAYHTTEIGLNHKITVTKSCWDVVYRDVLAIAIDVKRSAEVAVLLVDAGIANLYLLTSVLAKDICKVEQTIPKKKVTSTATDKALERFYETVYGKISEHFDFSLIKCVIVGGPSNIRNEFQTWLGKAAVRKGDTAMQQAIRIFVNVQTQTAHKGSLYQLLQNETVKARVANTKANEHTKALDQFHQMMQQDEARVCYGAALTREAADRCAIATLLVMDSLFKSHSIAERKEYVQLVDTVKNNGGNVLVYSSQHVSGDELKKLGEIAAILRFPCPDLQDMLEELTLKEREKAQEQEQPAPKAAPKKAVKKAPPAPKPAQTWGEEDWDEWDDQWDDKYDEYDKYEY